MSEIDSTELAQVFVGALFVVVFLESIFKLLVNYTFPSWMVTILVFGLIIGYYQRKD